MEKHIQEYAKNLSRTDWQKLPYPAVSLASNIIQMGNVVPEVPNEEMTPDHFTHRESFIRQFERQVTMLERRKTEAGCAL